MCLAVSICVCVRVCEFVYNCVCVSECVYVYVYLCVFLYLCLTSLGLAQRGRFAFYAFYLMFYAALCLAYSP